jgi:hypothetical protein
MDRKKKVLPLGQAPFIADGEGGSKWGRSQTDRTVGGDSWVGTMGPAGWRVNSVPQRLTGGDLGHFK